jgi:hypothetical protein
MKRLLIAILAMGGVSVCAQTMPNPSLGEQIAEDLAGVQADTTPVTWLQAHPGEKLEMFKGRQLANDTQEWCARTVVTHSAAEGRAWTRAVYFYDPEPPVDDALPPAGASKQEVLETTCQLGLVWIEIPETNPALGTGLAQQIEAGLQSRYGAGTVPRFPGGFGSAGWVEKRQWQFYGGALTAAYDQFQGKGRRALVRLAFPNSDAFHDLAAETRNAQVEGSAEQDQLIKTIKEVGLESVPTSAMTALLEADFFRAKSLPNGNQIADAFREWLSAAKSKPAGQQVTALLAADRELDFLVHQGVRIDDLARSQLQALGADFLNDELGGGLAYAHGWLKQAKTIAPPGPASDEVLLYEMERGFDETGMCSAGAEEFSKVIQESESLLAGARSLPAPTLASLHFMVGEAYATIVWLAMSNDDEYHDPKQYRPREASARAKALEHYRAAFQLEHGTDRAQKTWIEAWRLAVGLPPTSGRYFCVYD